MSLGLLGAYVSDSEDSEDSDSDTQLPFPQKEVEEHLDLPSEMLDNPFGASSSVVSLPKPSFMQEVVQVQDVKFDNSVFSNPFRDKEDKKKAILEHHVSMTEKQASGRTLNGKKVCWNYRKGRCRHGHKCTFAHDNDMPKSGLVEPPKYDPNSQIANDKAKTNTKAVVPLSGANLTPVEHMEKDVSKGFGSSRTIEFGVHKRRAKDTSQEESDPVMDKRKKRPGLSDSLALGKKAMKFHNQVKD